MGFIWRPIAKVQEGLGGKTRAIVLGVTAAVVALVAALILVPYPLKMDAKGQLLPKERRYIFSPVEGRIVEFRVKPGQDVYQNDPLVLMYDTQLETKMIGLQGEIDAARKEAEAQRLRLNSAKPEDKYQISADKVSKENTAELKQQELNAIRQRVNADPARFGYFLLQSPIAGTVLNGTFEEELTNKEMKPNEPILRVGNKSGPWEIELKILQKHIGQVLHAYGALDTKELDVDLVLRSSPTKTYRGKLARRDIGGEATPNRDDNNEAEPVVLAYVRIDGDDIDPAQRLPHDENFLVTGTEVVAKVRCGQHAMGYSLFYGVWEFFYEKVVFFF